MPAGRDYLTSSEVAKKFDVHVNTIARWANAGKIPARRTPGGGKWRFDRKTIDSLFAQYMDDGTLSQNGETTNQ